MNETVGPILGRKGREIRSVAPEAAVYDAIGTDGGEEDRGRTGDFERSG